MARCASAALLVPVAAGAAAPPGLVAPGDVDYLSVTGGGAACGAAGAAACPRCAAPPRPRGARRVRRSLHSLSAPERARVFAAVDVMKATTWADGLRRYGPAFRPYDYFSQRHAQAVFDPLGDQAHAGPWFMTWHRAFALLYEESLLAVDPGIGALPYWDQAAGADGVFGPGADRLGSLVGTGDGYTVADGAFAAWRVGVFNRTLAAAHGGEWAFGGWAGNARGELRSADNNPAAGGILRFPKCSGYEYNRGYADWERCATLNGTWTEWYRCVMTPHDMLDIGEGKREAIRLNYLSTGALHAEAHEWIGSGPGKCGYTCPGAIPSFPPPGCGSGVYGDYNDLTAPTNDPTFFFHHANVDRNSFHYARANPGRAADFYGYPATRAGGARSPDPPGTLLGDVASARWPYTARELGLPAAAGAGGALTHGDLICWVGADSAPYTYDSLDGDRRG